MFIYHNSEQILRTDTKPTIVDNAIFKIWNRLIYTKLSTFPCNLKNSIISHLIITLNVYHQNFKWQSSFTSSVFVNPTFPPMSTQTFQQCSPFMRNFCEAFFPSFCCRLCQFCPRSNGRNLPDEEKGLKCANKSAETLSKVHILAQTIAGL